VRDGRVNFLPQSFSISARLRTPAADSPGQQTHRLKRTAGKTRKIDMPRVSLAFFTFAAFCGLTGMGWGIYMGITQDHSTFFAHAHLNLLGWVSAALMGCFYALAKEQAPRRLSWVNFTLSSIGTVIMIPSIAGKIMGIEAAWVAIGVVVGSLAVFFGMASFLVAVVLVARKRHAARMQAGASPENPLPQLGLSG